MLVKSTQGAGLIGDAALHFLPIILMPVAVLLETAKEREISSRKNVPDAMIELGTTLTRPALYHLIFVWQG